MPRKTMQSLFKRSLEVLMKEIVKNIECPGLCNVIFIIIKAASIYYVRFFFDF